MKKISLIVIAVAVVSFFTLMSAGEEMSQEQKQQMEQIDQMVKEKVEAYKVEKDIECKTRAKEAARVQADSILAMSTKATTTKVVKTTTVKKSVKPVKSSKPTVTNRPGTNEGNKGTVTNRPGTNEKKDETGKKPTVTTRPGATKQGDNK